jgi:hypothetical protein
VQANWFQRETEGAIVGGGGDIDRVADDVVEMYVFCSEAN